MGYGCLVSGHCAVLRRHPPWLLRALVRVRMMPALSFVAGGEGRRSRRRRRRGRRSGQEQRCGQAQSPRSGGRGRDGQTNRFWWKPVRPAIRHRHRQRLRRRPLHKTRRVIEPPLLPATFRPLLTYSPFLSLLFSLVDHACSCSPLAGSVVFISSSASRGRRLLQC